MNKIDIAAPGIVVAPDFLREIRDRSWDGTVAVERISSLAYAITIALDGVANEAMARHVGATSRPGAGIDLGPVTNMREWAVVSNLFDLLKDQADACGALFEKVELATAKVTRDHRSGAAGRPNVVGGAL